jgi:hypothetical protein
MFVKNKASIDFKYRKNDYVAVLKAGQVSLVDEGKVSAEELRSCYGQRIDIISRDIIKQTTPETTKKEDLDETFISKVLEEIENESSDEVDDKEPDIKDEIAKLISKDIADFLNGKTDILPEGAGEISEEEAKKLENAIKVVEKEDEIKKGKESETESKASKTTKGNKAPKATGTKTRTRRTRTKKA